MACARFGDALNGRRDSLEALDLRILPLTEINTSDEDLSLLDRQERRRAARLRHSADRAGYIDTHILLRRLLGERLSLAPQEVSLVREPCPCCGAPRGRPAVGGPSRPLHFSLSRSGGWAMIAVAPDPIGVDIEAFPRSDTVAQVSHLLHSAERTEIRHAPAREQAKVFARIWTRKEAYLKAVGVGLAHQFATDYLASAVSLTGPADWFVFNVPAPSGFAAATAIRRGDGQVDRTGPAFEAKAPLPVVQKGQHDLGAASERTYLRTSIVRPSRRRRVWHGPRPPGEGSSARVELSRDDRLPCWWRQSPTTAERATFQAPLWGSP